MRSTVFVALQCCQCTTMQVKQQKKSNNKWVCVVCNQKQSVQKVFAQGYKAKVLRFFVQSFNMSRKSLEEEQAQIHTNLDVNGDDDGDQAPADRRKRRTDWNEYLDLPEHHQRASIEEGGDGSDCEPKITTEMPKEMFKKPRLKNHANASGSLSNGEDDDSSKLYKPVFSKRNFAKYNPSQEERKKLNNEKSRTLKPGAASKWNAYITQEEEEDGPQVGGRQGLKDDDIEEWSRAVLEISRDDQRVEDDIHPDFM